MHKVGLLFIKWKILWLAFIVNPYLFHPVGCLYYDKVGILFGIQQIRQYQVGNQFI